MKQPPLAFLLILLCFTFPLLPQAQTQLSKVSETIHLIDDETSSQSNPEDHFTCGTEAHHEYLMRTDAAYRNSFLLYTQQLDSALNDPSNNRSDPPQQYTIPVVVHVIHLGEPVGTGSNISDAQIQDAINGMNERYHNINGQGADIEIDFCLATRTPEGCPSTGIIRVNGSSVPNYTAEGIEYGTACGASESAIKALSHWPPLDYYNVWVVHDICGNWAGYAYFPNGGNLDGTVIGSEYMTGDGKTLSHELGHGLNLRHTFNGDGDGNDCPANTNCMNMGDLICDTPPHKRNDCGATNPCSNEAGWDNSRYNYMSYCAFPASVGRFTQDQRTRMRATMLVSPRAELQNSIGCTPMELPEIISDDDPMCSGDSKELSAMPQGGNFFVVSGPGTLQGNQLTATGEGTIVIQYTTCNYDVFQSIEAYQTPDPHFTNANDPMCSGNTRILSCEPPGGDFMLISGPGNLDENELTAQAAGNIQISYTISNNGCSGNTAQEIIVVPTPQPQITSSNLPICEGGVRMLSATPNGGDFYIVSGPASLNGNILVTEGSGTVILGYHIEINDCDGSTTQSIQVSAMLIPAITNSSLRMCSGDERILSAIPEGGNFSILSGPGVISGDTLTSTGAGEIHIQYSLNQNGCPTIATQNISSLQGPSVSINNPPDHMCLGDSITLHGSPIGGAFQLLSGPGALNVNKLTPTGEGNIVVGYSFAQNGCTGSAEKLITSAEIPQPVFTMDTSAICSGSSRALEATPEGGIFWVFGGPGVIGDSMLRSTGAGLIKLQYLVNHNGCAGDTFQFIPSRLTPQVEFATDTLFICVGEEKLMDIVPQSSQLNLLSGPGTLSDHLLTSTGPGVLELTGQYENNGCVGTDTLSIFSNPFPVPQITLMDTVLCNGNSIQLTGSPSGGAFNILSGGGALNGNILTAFNIGPVQIEYTAEEHHCAGKVYGRILVINPIAQIIVSENLLASATSFGVFQWLDCENNFEPLQGEINNTLIITRPGTFALVNGAGDCIDTSACVHAELISSYHEPSDQRIRVFPNPVTSKLFIDVRDHEGIREIGLYNSFGKKVKADREFISGEYVDMKNQPDGLYILVVKFDDGQDYVLRLVKM